MLSASSDTPFPSWSQFYCFYYSNSFPSGLPYLPMQNWFRDATFGAHYVVMATRILKFISPPLLPSMNSPPSLTTYVFCMRSKTLKTVGPLSSSGSVFFFFFSYGLHFSTACPYLGERNYPHPCCFVLIFPDSQWPAVSGSKGWGATISCASLTFSGSREIYSCLHRPQTCCVLFFISSPSKHSRQLQQ